MRNDRLYSSNDKELKLIYAVYNEKTIRVYQAFNNQIASEAIQLNAFGPSFILDRMTWIKPSFLWMMYRSGWGSKQNQEKILAIDVLIIGFEDILSHAVLTSYDSSLYSSVEVWKTKLAESDVRFQWDPDRDIKGNSLKRRTIQLGIKGKMLDQYLSRWIVKINDITDFVNETREAILSNNLEQLNLPVEELYHVSGKI